MHIDPSIGPDRARAVFDEELQGSASDAALRGLRHRWLARSGSWIAAFMEQLAAAAPADRKAIGRGANELKRHVEQAIEAREAALAATRRPEGAVDITLPGRQPALGFRHPLSLIREQIGDIFSRLGYQVLEGSEIEDDYHNFEALNMPAEHPARDMQDTLYLATPIAPPDLPAPTRGRAPRTHIRPQSTRLPTYLEKPCSFFKIASDDGNNARSSGVRQWPDEAASSSADMLMVSASIVAHHAARHCRWRLTVQNLIVCVNLKF